MIAIQISFDSESCTESCTRASKKDQLIEWIEHDSLDVVTLDPLNHIRPPQTLDENSASDMTVFLHALSAIRDATGVAGNHVRPSPWV